MVIESLRGFRYDYSESLRGFRYGFEKRLGTIALLSHPTTVGLLAPWIGNR
jgi:hypothetical protein